MAAEKEQSFCVCIAGIAVRLVPATQHLRPFFKQYLTDLPPRHTIVDTQDDIERERTQQKKKKDSGEGEIEKTVFFRKLTALLLPYDTLLVHGSCIAVDGKAYLFVAPSRTGKSTHTRLWREMLGDRAVMVNDDKPFVRLTDKGSMVYGSPWRGCHELGENIAVPLHAICLMSRATTNSITPLSAYEAYPLLLGLTHRPDAADAMAQTLVLVQRLCEQVACYALSCNKEPAAARVAYEAMSADNHKEHDI